MSHFLLSKFSIEIIKHPKSKKTQLWHPIKIQTHKTWMENLRYHLDSDLAIRTVTGTGSNNNKYRLLIESKGFMLTNVFAVDCTTRQEFALSHAAVARVD